MSKSDAMTDRLLPLLLFGAAIGMQSHGMKKNMLAGTTLIISMLVFTSSMLINDSYANDSEFNRRFYIGANVGISQLDPDASGIGATVDEKNDLGFGLNLGMDISNRISAEIHANVLGTATLAPSGEIDYQVYGLSAMLYGLNSSDSRDLRENFSTYLRLGLDTLSNSANVPYELENKLSLVLGLGAEFGMSNGLALRGELTRFYGDAHFAGLGLIYRFTNNNVNKSSTQAIDTEMAAPLIDVPDAKQLEPLIAEVEPQAEVLDIDTDGVLDDVDQCLDSTQNVPFNALGCPLFDGVMQGVRFESASAILTSDAQRVLSNAASELLSHPDIRVAVLAHTDNQGDAKLNLELSKKRVIAVVRYLLGQGVSINRMRAEAYGEKRPIASNQTAEGRLRNRRIEFKTIP